MTYTKKQFLEDVKKEAVALKKHALPEELEHLSLGSLDPGDETTCLYGLMTGGCKTDRACELIVACCGRYIDMPKGPIDLPADSFRKLKKYVNGKKVPGIKTGEDFKYTRSYTIKHFSAMEVYIMLPTAKNANLIDFLKGNRKDLVL